MGALARFEEGYDPYRFRGELQVFSSATTDADGDVEVPFHDHRIRLDFPGLAEGVLRLQASAGFSKFSNGGYYGLGADAPLREFTDAELDADDGLRRYHQYGRTYPGVVVNGRIELYDGSKPRDKKRLELLVGGAFSYNAMEPYAGSLLAHEIELARQPGPDGETLADLLHGTSDHPLLLGNFGLLWDTRDHEFSPSTGTFTELAMRASPGIDEGLGYAGFFLGTSWYAPIFGEHLVVASRTAVDMIVGDAPVYELSRYGVLSPDQGPGGAGSVRGVLLQRYHGKIKVIGNLELRGNFPWFTAFGERFRVGLVGFGDAGRVWADWRGRTVAGRPLDGPYAPLRAGLGGGVRLQWGETFIIRADLAQSPTDDTAGFYVNLGHAF